MVYCFAVPLWHRLLRIRLSRAPVGVLFVVLLRADLVEFNSQGLCCPRPAEAGDIEFPLSLFEDIQAVSRNSMLPLSAT